MHSPFAQRNTTDGVTDSNEKANMSLALWNGDMGPREHRHKPGDERYWDWYLMNGLKQDPYLRPDLLEEEHTYEN